MCIALVLSFCSAPAIEAKDGRTSPGGTTYTDSTTGMEFVLVKGGCYQMGCGSWTDSCYDDEKPVHEVCVDHFYMGKHEVTQGQWGKVMGNNPSHFKKCGESCPVEEVSWEDVQEFIKKLNDQTGGKYRLPTEAEWEYACRSGGKKEKYSGGKSTDSTAWHGFNSGEQTRKVGTKTPNGLEIYDMNGNVYEWVRDVFDSDAYSRHSRHNPLHEVFGMNRVVRGGSWNVGPGDVRCASRYFVVEFHRANYLGFRLVREP